MVPKLRIEMLMARLEKGRSKTLEILGSLAPDQWTRTVYDEPSPWTVRDLLAHFASAEVKLLELVQGVASGGPGAPAGMDYDAFNATEQRRLRGRSPQELLRAYDEARQATVGWVSTLGDAELDRTGRHPALGEVTVETMLTAMYGHQLQHMRDLLRKLA